MTLLQFYKGRGPYFFSAVKGTVSGDYFTVTGNEVFWIDTVIAHTKIEKNTMIGEVWSIGDTNPVKHDNRQSRFAYGKHSR